MAWGSLMDPWTRLVVKSRAIVCHGSRSEDESEEQHKSKEEKNDEKKKKNEGCCTSCVVRISARYVELVSPS